MTYPMLGDIFVRRSLANMLVALRRSRDEHIRNASMETENFLERDAQFRLASLYRAQVAGVRAAMRIIGE